MEMATLKNVKIAANNTLETLKRTDSREEEIITLEGTACCATDGYVHHFLLYIL
jgi:hypothetical protein